ncbi:hypothetical protein GCM10007989_00070 [Devosia pacifica]|uniref:Thiamine pyrimidine synthase n=1 Tax=Devosia pacifica TaxID=1335967 RepID=A0A918RSV8_9HYPH|nr:ABC transporter substrate-binding protein [Devosia pacifica]GHA09951.1 hypothetical protein GCM10007989_00070 [Devosia pacifica]
MNPAKRATFRRYGTSLLSVALAAGLMLSGASFPVQADAAEGPEGSALGSELAEGEVLVSEERCERNRSVGTITYVAGYGYSASAGQMDVILAEEMGYFDALCLDVEINAGGANGQQLVASGRAQFTELGSASDVMLAASNSENITAIATYGTTSPFSIFAQDSIESLSELEGRRLGYYINIIPMALAMLDAAGVDLSSIELIKMTSYDPTVVPRGQIEAIVGYASNQPQTLRLKGFTFSEFFPAEFGLDGTYNVMEVNSEFLRDHREVAADFMRASLRVLHHCLENETECVNLVSDIAAENNQGAAFPHEQQKVTWAVESEWVRGSDKPVGVHAPADWETEYDLVERYGNVTSLPPLETMMDSELVSSLYRDGELIWPGE